MKPSASFVNNYFVGRCRAGISEYAYRCGGSDGLTQTSRVLSGDTILPVYPVQLKWLTTNRHLE